MKDSQSTYYARWLGLILTSILFGLSPSIEGQQPELVVETGHSQQIIRLVYSPDGKILASASKDRTVSLWDVPTGRQIRILRGHDAPVWALAFDPDGKLLASAGQDRTIKLWSVATGKLLRSLAGHADEPAYGAATTGIFMIAFQSNGKVLLSATQFTLRTWDVATGAKLQSSPPEWGGTSRLLISRDGNTLATVGLGSVTIRDRNLQEKSKILSGYGRSFVRISLSHDGKLLATSDYNSTVTIWDTTSGKALQQLPGLSIYSDPVFSPDDHLLGTVDGLGKTFTIWNLVTGKELRTIKDSQNRLFATSVSFGPPNTVICVGDSGISLWSLETGELLVHFPPTGEPMGSLTLMSPDGNTIAGVVNWTSLIVWDLIKREARGFSGRGLVFAFDISKDGDFLARTQTGFDFWELSPRISLKHLGKIEDWVGTVTALSPNHKRLVTGGADDKLHLWDLATVKEIFSIAAHNPTPGVTSVSFDSNGKILASQSVGGEIKLWSAESGGLLRTLKHIEDLPMVLSIAFSPDGRLIATAGVAVIRVWNLETGQEVENFKLTSLTEYKASVGSADHPSELGAELAFSSNGLRLIRVSWNGVTDAVIRSWDVASKREFPRVSVPGSCHPYELSLSSGLLAGVCVSGVKIWEVANGKELRTIAWMNSPNSLRIRFSQDNHQLMGGGDDGRFRYWDVGTGRELATFIPFSTGDWSVVTPDGRFDTNRIENTKGLHWIMNDDPATPFPLEVLVRDYYEPRLLSRLLSGETLAPLPPLANLNRSQPRIGKISVVPAKNKGHADVRVSVGSAEGQCRREGKHVPCESGVYDLRLYRDGQLVGQSPRPTPDDAADSNYGGKTWREGLQRWRQASLVKTKDGNPVGAASGSREITFTDIQLPRRKDVSQVEFMAYAFNEDRVKSETSEPTIYKLPQSQLDVERRAYVITVGVDVTSAGWRLAFAGNGAREIGRFLKEKLGSQYKVVTISLTSAYKEDNYHIEDLATKRNLQTALNILAGRRVKPAERSTLPHPEDLQIATPDDLVVLYIASHGYVDPGGKFYVIPSDIGEPTGISGQLLDRCLKNSEKTAACDRGRELLQHSISSEELGQMTAAIDAGQMALILDSCHSGAVSGSGFKPGPMGDRGFGQLSYDKGMLVLAASQAEQLDWGTLELGDRSLLTYALTQQPTGTPFDLREWLTSAEKTVPNLYKKFVKPAAFVPAENSLDQRPALFDFAQRVATHRN